MNTERRFHPVAGIFPMMSDAEIAELAESIRARGQDDTILTHEGMIIDGRHRFLACRQAGVEPRIEEWAGRSEDLVDFVVAKNLRRRHLNESQRAMVAARLASLPVGANQHREGSSIELPSQEQAAGQLGVGVASVKRARVVATKAAPELVAAVDAGRVAVSTAAEVAELPQEEQRELVARGEKEILAAAKGIRAEKTERRRQERVARIAELATTSEPLRPGVLPPHPVILADPSWEYEEGTTDPSREIENHYPTMPLEEICALPVADVCTPDAVLYLWATAPKLDEAMRVIRAWGFRYRSGMVWDKRKKGMGYWARIRHEHLLIATRGEFPPPPPALRPDSVFEGRVGRHSKKPVLVHELLERLYPDLPKLELFAREPRDGWSVWGNESRGAA